LDTPSYLSDVTLPESLT